MKWIVKLREDNIKYQPCTTIKAHIVIDFVVEFSSHYTANGDLGLSQRYSKMTNKNDTLAFYIDGSSNARESEIGP